MALTKQKIIGLISITPDMQIQVREDTVVLDDGKELSRMYHRVGLGPGDDVSAYPPLIQAIAGLVWTPDVVAAWQEAEQARLAQLIATLKLLDK
jgi:hypothetical protein